jgi:Asp-tRNA(Asn)/Glu-tRNA(Gln) amidotransferase A subunit family amidase
MPEVAAVKIALSPPMRCPGTESSLTLSWREMDSNFQYASTCDGTEPRIAAASHRERAPPRPANGGFHATYDVLLTPALATLPPKLGWVDMTMDDVHEYWRRVFHFSPFTVCFNPTGQPAIVLPLGRCDATPERTTTGFPIAVQLVARYGDEATLFRLAA